MRLRKAAKNFIIIGGYQKRGEVNLQKGGGKSDIDMWNFYKSRIIVSEKATPVMIDDMLNPPQLFLQNHPFFGQSPMFTS